jgi:hypothetical protein
MMESNVGSGRMRSRFLSLLKTTGKWIGIILGLIVAVPIVVFMIGRIGGGTLESSSSEATRDIVHNSPWDGSVSQVEEYFNENLKDPKSLDVMEWGKVVKKHDGSFIVRCKYRARNSFGGFTIEHKLFALNSSGAVISVVDWRQ